MDFRNDNNTFGITHVMQQLGDSVPSYITNESADLTKLASSAFADEKNREYPINSKENTWKSIAYFYTQGRTKIASDAKASIIEKSLQAAATMHGIKEDAKNIIRVLQSSVKTASAPKTKEYAIERDSKGYLDISNIDAVVKSARELDLNYLRLEPTLAKTAAVKIVEKAEEFGIATKEYIPAFILDKGTERLFNYDYAIKVATERATETGCDLYIDLVESANHHYRKNGDSLLKYASEFYKLDRSFGKDNYADYGVQDPCDIFFMGVEKKAADKFAEENVLFRDIFIPKAEFKSEKFKDNVQSYFSKKTASEILSACEYDNTIDMKVALDKLSENIKLDVLKILAS